MTELYANVNNPMIQDGAKTEAMLLTGEKPITTDQYGIRVGKYDIPTSGRAQLLLLAIPLSHFHWFIRTKTVPRNMLLYAPVSAIPDTQKMQENRSAFKSALQYSMGFKRSHFVHE